MLSNLLAEEEECCSPWSKIAGGRDYNGFLRLAAQIAKDVLPNTYSEWQNTSTSYGQVKYLVNSIENTT